ncbi:MAG TPA: hypothetical protein VK864_17795 [Longimicrobiales bacterium]|nr:hypothetical protein [Longimicrobiales bacterium]
MDTTTLELLIPLSAVILGSLMFLIPIAGLTARFAIKPIMEAIAKGREATAAGTGRELSVLEQRVALLEQQYQSLETSVERLSDMKEFDRQLAAPGDSPPSS